MTETILAAISVWLYIAGFLMQYHSSKPFQYPAPVVMFGCIFWPIFAITAMFKGK